ncbi:MAG: lactate racemase domain-containing protein [Herpetosiphon sp.]
MMPTLPRMATIRQAVPTAPLPDLAATLHAELSRIGLQRQVAPGARIAIGAGSRGIASYDRVIRHVVDEVRACGGDPFVFPAMGSHGGATAEGQRDVLREQGITEQTMGCPIVASMDVVQVGTTASGIAVYCDAAAWSSNGIILCNRIKLHTDFHGPTESGITKMLAIGLGKREGAQLLHRGGVRGLRDDIPHVAAVHLAHSPILCGIAIIEDGGHNVSHVEALMPTEIPSREPELLERSRQLMACLPLEHCDLLIIDRMGKNISGAGMDPNIIGRVRIDGEPEPATPHMEVILALRLTPESNGNATGLGFADFVSQPLLDAMDTEITTINIATSGFPRRGYIPPALPHDRAAVEHAFACAMQRVVGREPVVMRIQDTLALEELQVSEAAVAGLLKRDSIQLVGPARSMVFDQHGALV